jgi:hypothetical protein
MPARRPQGTPPTASSLADDVMATEKQVQPRGEPTALVRSRPKKRQPIWPFLTAASVLACGTVIAVLLLNSGSPANQPREQPTTASKADESPAPPLTDSTAEAESFTAEQAVDDPKGELLWVSPTDGAPISLAYAPAGTQCLVYLRPAAALATPNGERLLAALGPWGQNSVAELRSMLGTDLHEVESLLLAIVPTAKGGLEISVRADLKAALSDDELARRFPSSQSKRHGEQSYFVVGDRASFVPAKAKDRKTRVVCPAPLAEELIDSAGEPPSLVRDVEALVDHTDADRTATLIIAPKFLEAGGNEMLAGEAKPVKEALHWLIGNDAAAVALSADLGDNFFLELRAAPALNVPSRRLALKLRDQIAAAPNAVEDLIASANWPPYGRRVLTRFPSMLRTMAQFTRAGDDDHQALLRCYLPAAAGHNLVMATELLLTQPRSAEVTSTTPTTSAPAALSIEDRLAKKTSLVFTKDSLERALEMLADDTGLSITIEGKDLQLDGITKNQSLAMDLRDAPAGDILVEILRRANPDRTATGPDDPRQKLVYVVQPGEGAAAGRIIVTTRAASARRGERLPAAFLPKKR